MLAQSTGLQKNCMLSLAQFANIPVARIRTAMVRLSIRLQKGNLCDIVNCVC